MQKCGSNRLLVRNIKTNCRMLLKNLFCWPNASIDCPSLIKEHPTVEARAEHVETPHTPERHTHTTPVSCVFLFLFQRGKGRAVPILLSARYK